MKDKKDISFILPTNRDHEQYAKKVINNINSLNFFGRTHEVVVISPNKIQGKNVVYLHEAGENNGCIGAMNEGYKISSGKYVILCSDDHYFDINCTLAIDILESRLFKDRKYKIVCLPTNKHGACKLPEYTNCDHIIARYPVFERTTVDQYLDGYICHPGFKHHYADNWLGYWLAQKGEPTIEINKFDMITFNNSCDKIHDAHDEDMFKSLVENYKTNPERYV